MSRRLRDEWTNVKNLLVMRLDNIGDVIMTGPALRAIRDALPEARITLMASPSGEQAIPLLPWVDESFSWRVLWQELDQLPFDPMREWALVRELQRREFDAAVIFTSFSQSPHPPAFICHLAGIPLRLGESKERGGGELTVEVRPIPDAVHQVDRNLRLIASAGFPVSDRRMLIRIPEEARRSSTALLAEHDVAPGAPYVLLNPWASCQARTYFTERFAEAARQLVDVSGYPVVITGVERDREKAVPLLEALGVHGVSLVGQTTVPELAALVSAARLVITNNTSVMHLADATGTPNLVTYSGTELESQWRPRNSPSRLLRRPTWCSPCYAFTCPYDLECLDFPPEEVVKAALELFDEVYGGLRR